MLRINRNKHYSLFIIMSITTIFICMYVCKLINTSPGWIVRNANDMQCLRFTSFKDGGSLAYYFGTDSGRCLIVTLPVRVSKGRGFGRQDVSDGSQVVLLSTNPFTHFGDETILQHGSKEEEELIKLINKSIKYYEYEKELVALKSAVETRNFPWNAWWTAKIEKMSQFPE